MTIEKSCGVCSVICDLPTKSPTQLRQEQLSDPEVKKIVSELESPDELAAQRWAGRGFVMERGVLYRYNPDSDSESAQLVIPANQVSEVLKDLHDSPLLVTQELIGLTTKSASYTILQECEGL